MPIDFSNPDTLKFLIENFDKEQEKCMVWFNKNREILEKKFQFPENHVEICPEDVLKVAITKCLPSFSQDYKDSKVNHRKPPIRDGFVRGLSSLKRTDKLDNNETEIYEEPVMLPIEPNVKNILHQRLPFGGRRQYLKARKYKIPEERYNSCQTTNNSIGWRLKDSNLSRQATQYGRYYTFIHDVNSRTGPHPDPAYYQQPPNDPYSKCSKD